jgi:polysaccharide biosynthesis transport protein
VLVLDGNLRREDLFGKMNVPLSHPGIEDLLAGTKAWADCLYHDPRRDIDIIFSHTLSPDRVMARKLSDFLQEVKSQYDLICIDSCPVMAADFTEYLAVRADVVVLVSQGDSALYRDLRRTAELFLRLGVPALAPVLNWGGEKKKLWFDVCLDAVSGACSGMACALAAKFSKKGTAEQ